MAPVLAALAALANTTASIASSQGVSLSLGLGLAARLRTSGGPVRTSRCPGQKQIEGGTRKLEPLGFIHIPRTGGHSIEDCTLEEKPEDRWGAKHPQLQSQTFEFTRLDEATGERRHLDRCFRQHVPPVLLPEHYFGRQSFCVVRDPYDRLIAQLGFQQIFFADRHNCTAAGLNGYLAEALETVRGGNPYVQDCHLLPQSAFVYAWDGQKLSVDRARRSCDYVLRFEHLDEDFDRLMNRRGYPYRLSGASRNQQFNGPPECEALTKEQIAPDLRRQIEALYSDDFDLLGYERMPALFSI